jgi:hypothetical protein
MPPHFRVGTSRLIRLYKNLCLSTILTWAIIKNQESYLSIALLVLPQNIAVLQLDLWIALLPWHIRYDNNPAAQLKPFSAVNRKPAGGI